MAMIEQLRTVYPNRRIRANTVAFDVETVLLYTPSDNPLNPLSTINAGILKYDDVAPYVMKHQKEAFVGGTTEERYCYLTVVPYETSHYPPDDLEVDPNLTDDTYADETVREVRNYKQQPRTFHINETCLYVPKGGGVLVMGPEIYLDQSLTSTYNYDWCMDIATDTANSDLIVIPIVTTVLPTIFLQDVHFKVNLAYVMSDFAMKDCIYSNKQVIRGNEYGAREHILF